jgi:ribose transport system substrate-binding protein
LFRKEPPRNFEIDKRRSRRAERELTAQGTKVEIIWKGPLREDDRDQQIQVVENFMTRQVSAIVLAPLDYQALVRPVQNAIKAGVPVVVMDSDLKSDQYVSFVATDNYKGGQLAGEHMGKLLEAGMSSRCVTRLARPAPRRELGFLRR